MGRLHRTLLDAVAPEKLVEAFKRLEDMAVFGDIQAIQVHLRSAVGRPTQAVELSGPDGESLGGDVVGLIMGALARHSEARLTMAAALRPARDDGPIGRPGGP